jgi:hypothetical protein
VISLVSLVQTAFQHSLDGAAIVAMKEKLVLCIPDSQFRIQEVIWKPQFLVGLPYSTNNGEKIR